MNPFFVVIGQVVIKGTITDASSGDFLPGVNVIVTGTNIGVVSDINGQYTIETPDQEASLSFSFIGYLSETIAVAGKTVIDVALSPDIKSLDEVVVIGYGSIKKSDLTGAVASVKPEDLAKLSTTNVQQAMQGRVAGVMVTSSSGAPGDDAMVRIRGISSANNSDPLYVVDGFPTGSIAHLNSSDIESMEVLKDASATAIYGNRGSNGVILVTTKKGKDQKGKITFNTYYGIQQGSTIPVLNAQEYANAKIMAYSNDSAVRKYLRPNSTNIRNNIGEGFRDTLNYALRNGIEGTDWQEEVLRTGHVQNYELGFSGGSEKFTYNLSGSFNRNEGIIKNSWNERYLLRYSGQAKLNDFIKTDVALSYRNVHGSVYDRDIYGQGILSNALRGDPISPIYLSDTNYYAPVDISATANPVAAVDRMVFNKNSIDQLVGNIGLDITILKGLVFSSKFGGDLSWNHQNRFIPEYHIGIQDFQGQSSLNEVFQRQFGWNNSNYLNFNKSSNEHSLNVMLGQEWSSFDHKRLRYTVFDVPNNPSLHYPHFYSNDPTPPTFNSDFTGSNRPAFSTSLLSYFGRVFYSFNSKYLVTVNARRDASSVLDKKSRWGFFPSFSLGWNIKNESFLRNFEQVSAFKLRYGWGKTGNIGSVYDPYGLYGVVNPNWPMVGPGDQTLPGAIQTSIPSQDLQWEEVVQTNFGLDFGLFANKLTGTVDYFFKKTTGMIINIDPPYFAALLSSTGNYGEMENKGVEVTLNYRNTVGQFKYEIGGNITFLEKPRITKWDRPWQGGSSTKINNVMRTEEGEEVAHFYGLKTDGLLTQEDIDNTYVVDGTDTTWTYRASNFWPGQLKLVDSNGDGVISNLDKTNIGSANPDFFYGFNVNLAFKGVDLTMFFQGVYGNELINGMNVWMKFPDEGNGNLNSQVLNSWTPENQNTSVPRLVQGNNIMQSLFNDYLVEDASYLRLKNIQVGYTLPNKIVDKIGLSNLRFYISGENIWTKTKYTGYDPEVGAIQYDNTLQRNNPLTAGIDQATYPIAKRFLFGLNVSF